MVHKIVYQHYDETRPNIQYEYLKLRDKLSEVFGESDTIYAKHQEL